jgi:O-antigen biosynthesis protein WbqP
MLRSLDIILALTGIIVLSPFMIIVFVMGFFDTGSPIFFQERVGKNKVPFILVKFRSMSLDSQSVASHLVDPAKITRFGKFLRRTKLDELPQLWNVLKGEMSFVGPRPCLANQSDLVYERTIRNVFEVRPGITGLAQINNIDMSNPKRIAKVEQLMLRNITLVSYFQYIGVTLLGHGRGDAIVKN